MLCNLSESAGDVDVPHRDRQTERFCALLHVRSSCTGFLVKLDRLLSNRGEGRVKYMKLIAVARAPRHAARMLDICIGGRPLATRRRFT